MRYHPPGDDRLRPPGQNAGVLDWFGRFYESVYCILHPFLRFDLSVVEKLRDQDELSKSDIETWVRPVTWSRVLELTGFPGLSSLNQILLSSIGAVRERRREEVRRLHDILRPQGIHDPDEGDFSPLQLDDFLRSLRDLGHLDVYVGDEFAHRWALYEIGELLRKKYPYAGEAHPTLYPPDMSVLYCVHWDSFYTFFAGSRSSVERVVADYAFEGFFAEADTRVYWWPGKTAGYSTNRR